MTIPALLSPDVFERIIDGDVVETAAINTLRSWFPVYLQEMEVQRTQVRGRYPVPRGYDVVYGLDEIPDENQLPAVYVVSPGLLDEPRMRGDGSYEAWWGIAVAIVHSGRDYKETRQLGRVYSAAARAIMLQKRSLGGLCSDVRWLDESYDDISDGDGRNLGVNQVLLSYLVENVVNRQGGPWTNELPDPDTQPGEHWPRAREVDIELEQEAL